MPSFYIDSYVTTGQTLAGFDEIIIARDGVVATGSWTITSTNASNQDNRVTNLGLLSTDNTVNGGVIQHDGENFYVYNAASGVIAAPSREPVGLFFEGLADGRLINAGDIYTGGHTVEFDGSDSAFMRSSVRYTACSR